MMLTSNSSEDDSVVRSTDGNTATIGCTWSWVADVALFAGGLLSGFSSWGWTGVSTLGPFNRLGNWDRSSDIVMSGLGCTGCSRLRSGVAWAALWVCLLGDFGVGDSADHFSLGDWCTLSESEEGSLSEVRETRSGCVGKGAWACSLFSKGVLLNLSKSVLEAGVGEGACWESEDNKCLFHFDYFV
jgi:hypothetical protein